MTVSFFVATVIVMLVLNFALYHFIRGVLELFSSIK